MPLRRAGLRPDGGDEPVEAGQVGVVAGLLPAALLGEHPVHRRRPAARRARRRPGRPGRSSRLATCSTTRIASSPSAPENSAADGSYSPTSGGTTAPTGMYGGLLTTRSTVPSSSGSAELKSPGVQADPAGGMRCGGGGSARCSARSTAGPAGRPRRRAPAPAAPPGRWPARSRPIRCPDQRQPARRRPSRSAGRSPSPVMTSVSGRGTKTPGPTSSSRYRKYAMPGDVLQRLARLAARDVVPEPRVEVGVGDQVELAPGHAVPVRGHQLGVGARRLDPCLGQPRRRRWRSRSSAGSSAGYYHWTAITITAQRPSCPLGRRRPGRR